jgi:hypothetical protein
MEAKREADVTADRQSFWHRHGWVKWAAGGLLAALALAAAGLGVALHRAEPYLRARIVEGLEDRFHARVELDSFHVSLLKGLWAEGHGLRIWPPARVVGVMVPQGQGEPLIRLDEFRFHAPLELKPGKPIAIPLVELKGLRVHLPPKSHFEHGKTGNDSATGKPRSAMAGLVRFEVDKMECTGAELVMETDKPGKLPLEFQIAHFTVTDIASGGKIHPKDKDLSLGTPVMGFDAEVTIPKPEGTVKTTGSFGPWQGADLGDSPIAGDYRFEHADLGVFKGIAGILSSTGHYEGTLRALMVDGQAETPDFRLTHFGAALPLVTRFHARVDGTNGDTWLEPVDATLGHSHFTAQGAIVRVPGAVVKGAQQYTGHDIALTVNVDKARMEDFLRLASRTGNVLLTGDVTMKTSLHIPPGVAPLHKRLKLNGSFALDKARFTSNKIQERIAELSLRGQGRPDEVKSTDAASILSQMQGSFRMAGGAITLPALEYTVPGATIQLAGTYGLADGALKFEGTAKMEASVSKMVGGWKGMLLTPADRHFKKDGAGTEIPIHIGGTREAPKFGIGFERLKPGEKQ